MKEIILESSDIIYTKSESGRFTIHIVEKDSTFRPNDNISEDYIKEHNILKIKRNHIIIYDSGEI